MFVQAFAAARYAHGQEKADAIRSAQRHLAAMEQDKLGEMDSHGCWTFDEKSEKKTGHHRYSQSYLHMYIRI